MKVITFLIIVFLTPFLILLNFRLLVFNHTFYKSEFTKNAVYNQFPQIYEVDRESKNLLDYLCCTNSLSEVFFTNRERLHLTDVKNLIRLVNLQFIFILVLLASCIGMLLARKKVKWLLFGLIAGAVTSIVSITFLYLATLLNFDLFFMKFHLFAFNNDFWQLPPDANLIKLFPQQFFVSFANRIAYQTIIVATAILLVSFFAKRKYNAKLH